MLKSESNTDTDIHVEFWFPINPIATHLQNIISPIIILKVLYTTSQIFPRNLITPLTSMCVCVSVYFHV